jgi:hypothetical protein
LKVLLLLLDAGDGHCPTATLPAFAYCLQAPTWTPPTPTATRRSCTGTFKPFSRSVSILMSPRSCRLNNAACAQVLLQRGANPNIRNSYEQTVIDC